jgi:hypothetical protein
MGNDKDLSGLPWGSLSLKHKYQRAKLKKRNPDELESEKAIEACNIVDKTWD